jgi:hypothetical protein
MSVALHPIGQRASSRSSEGRSVGRRVRTIGLGVFFASVAVNAAIGIYALVTPHFGHTQQRVLLSSLCVTGAVLLALACEPAWERKLLGPVPAVGALLGTVVSALTIAAIWTEPSEVGAKIVGTAAVLAIACAVASLVAVARERARETVRRVLTFALALLVALAGGWVIVIWVGLGTDDVAGKMQGTTFTVALGCTAATLLSLARLAPRHRWVLVASLGLLTLGVAMLTGLYWFGDAAPEAYARGMGVILVAFAAFAVTVPVLHWIDRGVVAAAVTTDAIGHCPHCGAKLAGELGVETRCGRCGRGFTVTAHESRLNLT